ncbi:unnamed protein product, partial [Mesorhabditis spiculigera]
MPIANPDSLKKKKKKDELSGSIERRKKKKGSRDMSREPQRKEGGEKLVKKKENEKAQVEYNDAMKDFVQKTCAGGFAGLSATWNELKAYTTPNATTTAFTAHGDKNRYKDIPCIDATRVKLNVEVEGEDDYIHANWCKLEGRETFIATQGPLDNTIVDFWRMCWDHEVVNIVQLCRVVEDGKNKCAAYWPEQPGGYQNHGRFFVNNKKKDANADNKCNQLIIELLPDGCSNSRIIRMIQMPEWPDHGVPNNTKKSLRIIRALEKDGDALNPGNTVLHCSAGAGRTGAIMLVHWIKSALFANQKVDATDVFKKLRDQRACSVQTEQQWLYVFAVVMDYIRIKAKDVAADDAKLMQKFLEEGEKSLGMAIISKAKDKDNAG